MRKISLLTVLVLALPVVWLVAKPSPIDSAAWTPPPAPGLIGKYAVNNILQNSELLAVGKVYGPEDVDVDNNGIIYGGTQDGKIVRVHPGGRVEDWVDTGGRPLGLHFDADGNLIVCDAYKGLLSVDPQGIIRVLVDTVENQPLVFTDDLDIASDGKIYFTDASSKWSQANYILDLLEAKPYGRFMVYDPVSKETTVLIDNMYFPNGVALSQDEEFVLVNETWRYRIIRYWLRGERQGEKDIFVDNLPGFPDGISSNRKGTFWVAFPTPRNEKVDNMHPKPWLKNLVAKLPQAIQPRPVEYGLVLGLNEMGEVTHNLQDPSGETVKEITSVQEHDGMIYLGTLHNDRIGKLAIQ